MLILFLTDSESHDCPALQPEIANCIFVPHSSYSNLVKHCMFNCIILFHLCIVSFSLFYYCNR